MVGVMMASAVPFTTTVVDTVLGGMDAVAMDAILLMSRYCTLQWLLQYQYPLINTFLINTFSADE